MNKIWTFIFIVGGLLILISDPAQLINSAINASEKAVTLSITLLGIYSFWLGLLELVKKTKLNEKLSSLLKPLLKKLFGKQNNETNNQIAINISSNMLGLGNASTPSGIEAMKGLDKGTGKITKAMAMLMIINTTAIQIIPTTIIGLRAANGSEAPSSVVLPTLIATTLSTLVGILLVLLISKFKNKKDKL